MEKMMASFGEGYTKTQVISENNSIKYKFSFAPGSELSTPSLGYFTFQDERIGDQQDGVGINVREFNPAMNTISPKKTFNFLQEDSGAPNKAFLEYLATFPSTSKNLLVFTTFGDFNQSPSIEAKFKSFWSTLWPSKWHTDNYFAIYAGLYSIEANRMIAENVTYSDGVSRQEDLRPAIEYVYDKANDIGATGFSYRALEDFNEYVSSNDTIKRYPISDVLGVPIASVGIKVSDKMLWSFEFLQSTEMVPGGRNIRVSLRWLSNTGSLIKSENIDSNPANAGSWIKSEKNIEVPVGAERYTIVVSKTNGTNIEGEGGVRSMILTKVSRSLESSTSTSISVNGIRMNSAVSGDDPTLLKMAVPEVDSNGNPLPGEDLSGHVYSADWREFEKDI
ncbi:long tail fiber protein proximal connector [Citrobacter phage Merlin]|uniref:Hinge connector of long tail fiber proximal connector n=1 Tax=Citrobacter phage Merlin TaxID=1675602 RepID=A0A0K1LP23_9CAUD|nr:long tail fiber protein proximal connector [Citrobacter phage Merlin]AKU43923.1 hinge connector of long tail fiber proximal connector [Citrobacter phage Merlin]